MKVHLKTCLNAVVVGFFVLSLTGYAHGRHNGHDDHYEFESEVTFENLLTDTRSDVSISHWFEQRLNQELQLKNHIVGKKILTLNLALSWDEAGHGWCDRCGCWMRHGSDPNGNSEIGHIKVCVDNRCTHSGDCSSSGGNYECLVCGLEGS